MFKHKNQSIRFMQDYCNCQQKVMFDDNDDRDFRACEQNLFKKVEFISTKGRFQRKNLVKSLVIHQTGGGGGHPEPNSIFKKKKVFFRDHIGPF